MTDDPTIPAGDDLPDDPTPTDGVDPDDLPPDDDEELTDGH